MEANIQIKSAKVEGNKVTDLEFYGDWIAELGGSGPSYIDCHMSAISANTLPKNIFTVTTGTWTNGQHSITLKLQNRTLPSHYIQDLSAGVPTASVAVYGTSKTTINAVTKTAYGIFLEDDDDGKDTMVGYFVLDPVDGTTEFEYTEK